MAGELYPCYEGKPVIPDYKRGVLSELEEEDLDLEDVVEILETGFDCSASKRDRAILERCVQRKNRIIKVVVEEGEEYWGLRHVGSFKLNRKEIRRRMRT
jgi:exonuclease VII small subunit